MRADRGMTTGDGRRTMVRSWRGTNDEHGDERRQRTVSGRYEKGDWQRGEQENGDPIKRRVLLRWLSSGQHLRAVPCYGRATSRLYCVRSKDKSNLVRNAIQKKSRRSFEIDSSLLAPLEIGKQIDETRSWRSRQQDKLERFVSCAIRYQTN